MKKIPTYNLDADFSIKLEKLKSKFIADGFKLFAKEFELVGSFVTQAKADSSDRSDHQLRRSEKERYLLELLSYKLYDELNTEAFNAQKNTLIIMPDCLSIHEYDCNKTDSEHGAVCESCHPDCDATEITKLAEKYNIEVLFSKRNLSEQLLYHEKKLGDTSVIGIACIMMLSAGMRVAHQQNIPARGVLLQNTGCEHWNDSPFASQFSIEQLKSILVEKYGH